MRILKELINYKIRLLEKILDRLYTLFTDSLLDFVKTAVWQKHCLVMAGWVCGISVLPVLFKLQMFIFMTKCCIKYSSKIRLCLQICGFYNGA